ncbi:hypothetical protein F441_00716 [Phytophthora nicotianae CJ01A1]|uniref:Uncharacterized protein n=6 Tax=Phytophthora nicotianae TaxID=4792 RepID=W2RFL6_PHYN3|nr:hypothetical protein PPTG_20763 [Phytophthora nicotianae INRA-310]ETI56907.1 hypothetical protein F443_00732 [Phytophthora nicotianae P1569]ETK96677.1 hypothetical protein L915_00675 [Phytophthora nicotianae]ETO85639.1 hypothetical protein F444_00722 [Phytophthora nicotianae P1976]ETP26682.1 hypothetical protein F441_00716 [Phytophthora nicotianae CJ01A1]ETP54677.1 hypothetical protein F442_00684 [Phytophthora nicotianae P10297]
MIRTRTCVQIVLTTSADRILVVYEISGLHPGQVVNAKLEVDERFPVFNIVQLYEAHRPFSYPKPLSRQAPT